MSEHRGLDLVTWAAQAAAVLEEAEGILDGGICEQHYGKPWDVDCEACAREMTTLQGVRMVLADRPWKRKASELQ